MTTREFIKNFLEDIVKEAGFEKFPEGIRDFYLEKIELSFLKRLGVEIMALFSDKDLEDFEKLLKENPNWTNDQIFEFCETRIENLPQILAKVMIDFRKEYLETARDLKEKVGAGSI